MSESVFMFDERLDREFLESMFEGDLDHARVVFEQFLQLAPAQMQEIESRYQEGILEEFRQKVHKIKPVFSFVGLTQMTSLAESLENQCKLAGSVNQVSSLYEEFRNNYAQFFPVIENEYSRLKA